MDGGATGGRPHGFTVADYYRMAEAGIFNEDSRVELIRGQIVDMPAIGTPHFGMVNRLTRVFCARLAGQVVVSVQNPLRLDDASEPQPDVVLLKHRADDYETTVPRPPDALLVIEVADASLAYDHDIKAPLYAESGIMEYWIVNLLDRVIEVHRHPEDGRYGEVRRICADGVLDIQARPGTTMQAAELLRPAAP